MGIKIKGCGYYVPEVIASNEDFSKIVDTSDEWITTRTGIKTRHIANDELAYQMGAIASRKAIQDAKIDVSDIDMIIGTTVTGDCLTPSLACLVGKELGVENAMCYDINAACAGYVFALDIAHMYLSSKEHKNILIVSSEIVSRMVDYKDRSTCVLFGDGAAATVVSYSDSEYKSYISSDPQGADKIFAKIPSTPNPFRTKEQVWCDDRMQQAPNLFMQMAGNDVYKFATTIMPEAVMKATEKTKWDISDLDYIIPHQANIRIVQTAIKKLKLPDDKFYINIQDFGNISSACIPLALSQLKEQGKLEDGKKICVVGFGAGLTYGAAVFEY